MRVLSSDLRKELEATVIAGRHAAETGVRAAFSILGVEDRDKPSHLSDEQAQLRRGLRAKQRQLGGDFDVLVWDAAYEQWHRLLFARFLADNDLLRHPEYEAPVTLEDCEELAQKLGEPDGWSVAARFAAAVLPGIFRLDDPCVRLRLAPEHRIALERIVEGLPSEVFTADDSLGWVYQYWQSERKDEVNASEEKVGGADLGPVTQLFTENYMVRFLLENSLGAWWASRHPNSPLLRDFQYLRFDQDGEPAAGTFHSWPDEVAEVTVMDPCCGSGHFLVEAFGMLWRMRAEEEDLDPVAAQDAALRENLFGLELDSRCVQIAMFAVALTAWKQGGGWRKLPVPNIACSGIPAKAPLEEWAALAGDDQRLRGALERLHELFGDADTLGSLIDPRRTAETGGRNGIQRSLDDVDFEDVAPLLNEATTNEPADPGAGVLGADAAGVAHAAMLLSKEYSLVATNVPYLGRRHQCELLKTFGDSEHRAARTDLATMFVDRWRRNLHKGGALAVVTPHNWLSLKSYRKLRQQWLSAMRWQHIVRLGSGAFSAISGQVVNIVLFGAVKEEPDQETKIWGVDVSSADSVLAKADLLGNAPLQSTGQVRQLKNPDAIPLFGVDFSGPKLGEVVDVYKGLTTGDDPRFRRHFWELCGYSGRVRFQSAPNEGDPFSGQTDVVLLEALKSDPPGGFRMQPIEPLGAIGVSVGQSGSFPAGVYTGTYFDQSAAALIPKEPADLNAVLTFCGSDEYTDLVRKLDKKIIVTAGTLVKVPFDKARWRKLAQERFPKGLPEPRSDNVKEWFFHGRLKDSTDPLQVGVAQLLGFLWPRAPQHESRSDSDGIVCLPAVAGERSAAKRLEELLIKTYGSVWSAPFQRRLVEGTGARMKSLDEWLRDDFFSQHCSTFLNRPFIWHIWDGRKDGFSALVNYHRLDRAGLEKLTYTYLGDWIERQRRDTGDEVGGAALRLSAAEELKNVLEAILRGERPYDIYIRWKELHEQPVGWNPHLEDGVRLNIRPFVKAGILRSKFRVHWKKDRGKNPDGSERHNDVHLTIAEKQEARKEAGRA